MTAEEKPDNADGEPDRPPAGWLSRHARGVIIALALTLVVTTAATGYTSWKLYERSETDNAAHAALAAAQQYAVTLTSIDATRIDDDFAAIDSGATGEFKTMYTESAAQLRPLLVEAQSVSKGRVLASAIQSATTMRVVVMVFVDAEITNTTTAGPRIDRNRILLTMDHVDGRWLASKVELT